MLYSINDEERISEILKSNVAIKEPYRTSWRRDYARLIHSPSFRRLQGKTQVFPIIESDFFRNRLTHSIEVAQISKDIAIKLNSTEAFLQKEGNQINLDIVEFAALAHDLGHPPFGHQGEKALDACMRKWGGVEGNAQTLRVLTKIEKRQKDSFKNIGIDPITGEDKRYGLNLTARILASILKYDNEIAYKRDAKAKVEKGFYGTEKSIVEFIKEKVAGKKNYTGEFKTIECQIMDLADDIAYSTYDLEDTFKVKFLTPLDCLTTPEFILEKIACQVTKDMKQEYNIEKIKDILFNLFDYLFDAIDSGQDIKKMIKESYVTNNNYVEDGYLRSALTSSLISTFIQGIVFNENKEIPALSIVNLKNEVKEKVLVLKHLTYYTIISSHLCRVPEYRGCEVVQTIFKALISKDGASLLPGDYKNLFEKIEKKSQQRIICDFIANMTDRYVLEFYGRLKSENPQTIFKPI
ncbi:MAG: dGTP triphosphohydrolase [Candidatus Margulisiibacteriota bacterium]